MPTGYNLTPERKQRIIEVWKDTGLNYREIAIEFNLSYETIATLINKYKKTLCPTKEDV